MFDFERYSVSGAALSIMEGAARIAADGCVEYLGAVKELQYSSFNTIDIYASWASSQEYGVQFIRCSFGDKKTRQVWATLYKRGEFAQQIAERFAVLQRYFGDDKIVCQVIGWRPINVSYVTFGKAHMRIPSDTYKTKVTPNAARSRRSIVEKTTHEETKAARTKPRNSRRRRR